MSNTSSSVFTRTTALELCRRTKSVADLLKVVDAIAEDYKAAK